MALLAVMAGLLLGGCARSAPPQEMIEITLDRPENSSVTTELTKGRAVIDVVDKEGINGLNARLVEGEWPEEVIIRLHLRGLESLEISYSNFTIATGVPSTGDPGSPLILSVVDEAGHEQSVSPSADVYYPDIQVITPDGVTAVGPLATGERPPFPLPEGSAFEITLPPHFHHGDHLSFSLQWIDFYR